MNDKAPYPPPASPLRVLYDGGCPLCRREIAVYQHLRPMRPVLWHDIDADWYLPEQLGITREEAMARFHVLDGERVQSGATAFLLLWSAMPGWRHLAALVERLGLEAVLERGYRWFARRRLRRRCSAVNCRIPEPRD
jgi:predicted DCC family thiol-disulfide oxidoreductase YuxK